MPQILNDKNSRSIQVVAWCHQATIFMSPYGVTKPHYLNIVFDEGNLKNTPDEPDGLVP